MAAKESGPDKKKGTAKKTARKTTAAGKSAAEKKSSAKKTAPKKDGKKKTARKKAAAKSATRKTAAKKPAAKKSAAGKSAPQKTANRKAAPKGMAPRKARASRKAGESATGLTYDKTAIETGASDNLVVQMRTRQFDIEPPGVAVPAVTPAPPPTPAAPPVKQRELPEGYDETQLTLLARDPEWAFAFWEVSDYDRERHALRDERLTLRLYDVSDIEFDGTNAHRAHDIAVGGASSWYLHLPETCRQWIADLGVTDNEGRFVTIARSNVIAPPRDRVSPEGPREEEWMTVETDFEQLFELSGGRVSRSAGGSEAASSLGQRVEFELPRLRMGSEELASGAVARGRAEGAQVRGFFLRVETELIVYGATVPGASLSIQGHPIRVHPDGTFRLRLELPDGSQEIPVRAVSEDGEETREITPVVTRETR